MSPPKLLVIAADSKPPSNFSYGGESFVVSTPSVIKNTSLFYNEVLFEKIDEYDAFAFLEGGDSFTFIESCEIIIEKLFESENIGALYSDYITVDDEYSLRGFTPSFTHQNYTHSRRVFHQPIFAKRQAIKNVAQGLSSVPEFTNAPPQYFDSRIKRLCFHGVVSLIANTMLVRHVAEPLFTCYPKNFQDEEVNEDLSVLFG